MPGAGFAGLIAPKLLASIARFAGGFDVVHVHLARDLITMPAATIAVRRSNVVLQPHGMIQPDRRVKARAMDILSGTVFRRAGAVLFLTPAEEQGLHAVAESMRLRYLPNGIDVIPTSATSSEDVVLFCARLHPRKRVLAFVEMAAVLAGRGVKARFLVAGPDGGELPALRRAIRALRGTVDISYIGPVAPDAVRDLLASAAVFVLPSVDEPFPMTVLEALAAATPVVLTDTCAIADDLAARGAALVTDGSARQLADAVQLILTFPERTRYQVRAGIEAIHDKYAIATVVDQLEAIYRDVVHGGLAVATRR